MSDREPPAVARLRQLAREGRLAATLAESTPAQRVVLGGAAYAIVWPVVYTRLTRQLERRRGHGTCAVSVHHLAADCLDRFEDDTEAAVVYLLTQANQPIHNLEGWIASRLTAATVDAHRRQRGERGALQRPRLPGWLDQALGQDPWLGELAVHLLTWVGVTATAGTGLWPLQAWAQLRASALGAPVSEAAIEADVETVLAATRRRPAWHQRYVEGPLGRKSAPVVLAASGTDGEPVDWTPLCLTPAHEIEDGLLLELAAEALDLLASRLGAGEDPRAAVVEVLTELFGHSDAVSPDVIDALLLDPAALARLVESVLHIVVPDAVGV